MKTEMMLEIYIYLLRPNSPANWDNFFKKLRIGRQNAYRKVEINFICHQTSPADAISSQMKEKESTCKKCLV